MRRAGVVLVIIGFALAIAAALAAAQYKPEFKISLVVGPSGPWSEAAIRFADLLKERTQGRINVKNYLAGLIVCIPPPRLWRPDALGIR